MNSKLIAMIAAACLSTAAMAQTQPAGTSNTGTPTQGQSAATSGEQQATTMQNNSNTQNTAPAKTAKEHKMAKTDKNKVDCNTAHTDGGATAPAHAPCEDKAVKSKR
jgi:Ni/Co efflux regulator RcnB